MNCLVRNHRNGHPERTYDASQEEKNKPKTHSFWKNYATNDHRNWIFCFSQATLLLRFAVEQTDFCLSSYHNRNFIIECVLHIQWHTTIREEMTPY